MSSGAPGQIPLLDLARQHESLSSDIHGAIAAVAGAQAFVLGENVGRFEAAMAEYLGVRHAIGVASGTDAIYVALRTLDLQPGDEIVTTPFTFFATAGAIHNAGGRAVFADIDPRTFNIDPDAAAQAIGDRTRAIMPVHLFGQMAAMEPLLELGSQHGVLIIEDAAQAIGGKALVDGAWQAAGSVGAIGCFSFYPTKNLGGWGDGGLVVTDDDATAARLRSLRVHGQASGLGSYAHEEVGINSRLDGLQAVVLATKLPHLGGWNEARRACAALYDQGLAGISSLTTPVAESDRFHVYHLYTIRAADRDELRRHLGERGVGAGVYYPLPLHLQPCFAYLGYGQGDFPESERAADEVLSLPLFPGLTTEEQGRVVEAVEEYYR